MARFWFADGGGKHRRDRSQVWIERGLPGAILIVVAIVQIYLTQTANLSPWKGGGFGMFGAIDAPDMRVIQAEALVQDGSVIQLDVYSALDVRTIRRTRPLPRQRDLEQMAPQFISKAVVPTTIQRQAIYHKLQSDNPDVPGIQDLVQNGDPEPLLTFPDHPITQPLYRLKTVYDPDVPGAVKTVKAIRLRWWRVRFDAESPRLWAEPLGAVVEAGAWQ